MYSVLYQMIPKILIKCVIINTFMVVIWFVLFNCVIQ